MGRKVKYSAEEKVNAVKEYWEIAIASCNSYALSQLKRNPMMKSKKYQEIIKLLNEWNKDER